MACVLLLTSTLSTSPRSRRAVLNSWKEISLTSHSLEYIGRNMKPAARSARPVAAMLVNIGDESRSPMVLGPPSPLGSPPHPPHPPPPEDEPEEEEDPDPLDASLAASCAALPAPAASGPPGLEGLAGLPPLGWKFSHPELGFFGASAQKARLMASNSLRTASAALERGAALLTRSPRREAASAARAAAHVLTPAPREAVDATAPRSAASHPWAGPAAGTVALRAALARALFAVTANMSATGRDAAQDGGTTRFVADLSERSQRPDRPGAFKWPNLGSPRRDDPG